MQNAIKIRLKNTSKLFHIWCQKPSRLWGRCLLSLIRWSRFWVLGGYSRDLKRPVDLLCNLDQVTLTQCLIYPHVKWCQQCFLFIFFSCSVNEKCHFQWSWNLDVFIQLLPFASRQLLWILTKSGGIESWPTGNKLVSSQSLADLSYFTHQYPLAPVLIISVEWVRQLNCLSLLEMAPN